MFQKVIVVGNLGTDPELRSTASGQQVCSFSVASNRKFTTSSGEQRDETTWFRVSVWGRMAEVCNQYLSKGRQVLCEGRLTPDPETGGPRVWTDQNGNARASFELNAQEVKFLGTRSDSGGGEGGNYAPRQTPQPARTTGGGSYQQPAQAQQPQPVVEEDDMPF